MVKYEDKILDIIDTLDKSGTKGGYWETSK